MLRKTIKIIFLIVLILVIVLQLKAFAMSVTDFNPQYTTESSDSVSGVGKELLGIIRNISVIASVVILAYIGLTFIFGSVEQKADYKKSLLPLVIGIIVVMSATTITGLVWSLDSEREAEIEQECEHDAQELDDGRVICRICRTRLN